MPCLILQVSLLYIYIYSPERLNNTSIIFHQSLSLYPSTWYQSGKILDLAAAPLLHRGAPREVDPLISAGGRAARIRVRPPID
jgi:hypothetical protein